MKTQLMHKNVQTNPENSQKFTQRSCCSMLTWEQKHWKQSEAMDIVSSLEVGRSLPKTIMLVVRSSGLWEAYTKPAPNGNFFTTTCWCRSMIACQVSWISDELWIYYNFKTRYLNVSGRVTVAGCLTFIPISCMGPKHATKDTNLNFQPIYMH